MTHFSRITPLLIILFLLLAVPLICIGPAIRHSSADSGSTGIVLTNLESFNDYGQFMVNDTLGVGSNATQSISAVTFGFPLNYSGHIYSERAFINNGPPLSSSSISSSVSNQALSITISLPIVLSPESPGNVTMSFYVVGVYVSENTTASSCSTCYYRVPMLLFPSVSVPSSSVSVNVVKSNITFPDLTVTQPSTNSTGPGSSVAEQGFSSQTTSTFFRLYNSTVLNANTSSFTNNVRWANVSVSTSASSGGIVDFQNIKRSFTIDSSGSVIVTDSFSIRNLGPSTLSSLDFSVLTGTSSTTVRVEPFGEPLLSNAEDATVISGKVDVLSGSGQTIEPNATLLVIIQYPLGRQYWNYSGAIYNTNVPLSVPIAAVVDQFQTVYDIPSGFVTLSISPPLDLYNASGYVGNAIISYRSGIGSSYGSALPVAGVAFLGVFIAALLFRPRGENSGEEIETTLTTLIKAAEDKVSGTNDILTELKSKASSVNKVDLSTARQRIEDLRSKSSGKFGAIRSELSSAGSASQAALSGVATDDREFDRTVRDLLNVYDQFISRRMKQDAFSKAQQNNERRIQRITNSLLDGLQDLRREYEQEQ